MPERGQEGGAGGGIPVSRTMAVMSGQTLLFRGHLARFRDAPCSLCGLEELLGVSLSGRRLDKPVILALQMDLS